MTNAACPSCGAPVTFLWASSVQTTCGHCKSILVRTDVDLEKVGVVSDLPADPSPLQIGTSGSYRNNAFTLAGRIIYEYDEGFWNEWHIEFNGGRAGWLSDAQLEYAVSFAAEIKEIPAAASARLGTRWVWNGTPYFATTITKARYRGVEGELPFKYWDKGEATFVDLRSTGGGFATLDYSDDEPRLYLGEIVEFDALQLKNLRRFEGWS
jgi:hypothetical protein